MPAPDFFFCFAFLAECFGAEGQPDRNAKGLSSNEDEH